MRPEIKKDEFKDDRNKWHIYFDMDDNHNINHSSVLIRIGRINYNLTEKDLENLKQDLKDLGKLRIIKQGEKFLKWNQERREGSYLRY